MKKISRAEAEAIVRSLTYDEKQVLRSLLDEIKSARKEVQK